MIKMRHSLSMGSPENSLRYWTKKILIDILDDHPTHLHQIVSILKLKTRYERHGERFTNVNAQYWTTKSLRLRLKMFTASIGPILLTGMTVLLMTRYHLQKLDILQRKMLRRIVGWRRIDGEDWKATMKRMNDRLEQGHNLYVCQPWSMVYARSQWRYIKHMVDAYLLLWALTICKVNNYWKIQFHLFICFLVVLIQIFVNC